MPRYFFHLRGDDLLMEDMEGMDLPNLHAALDEALRVRRELALDTTDVGGLAFEVATREGRTLLKVPVDEGQRAGPALPH
jgi:hypothetical protein